MTRTTGDRERSRLGESATGGLNTLRLESRLESEEEIRMAIPIGPRAGRLTFEGDFATLTFERTLRHPVEAVGEAITDPDHLAQCYLTQARLDPRRGAPIDYLSGPAGPHGTGRILEGAP